MAIAAGEYGYDGPYFERMLAAEAVDVMQADVTRCGGVTGILAVGAMCEARNLPLSCHCGPAIHTHVAAAIANLVHVEYFHDHARIERMIFDGLPDCTTELCGPIAAGPEWDSSSSARMLRCMRREVRAVAPRRRSSRSVGDLAQLSGRR